MKDTKPAKSRFIYLIECQRLTKEWEGSIAFSTREKAAEYLKAQPTRPLKWISTVKLIGED